MPERKPVTPLKVAAGRYVLNRIYELSYEHRECRNCNGYGIEALLRSFWNSYYSNRGIKETYDCSKIVEAVDFILSYASPSELKHNFSEYFRVSVSNEKLVTFFDSIGYRIMTLLHRQSNIDFYCSKIKNLVETFGLSYLTCSEMEQLNHFLPLCENLKILNIEFMQSNDDTLLTIGQHCDNLEELRNIVMERYSLEGLKKMLYSDPDYTTKRRICESLKIVSSNEKKAPVTNWSLLSENEKIETSDKWYQLFQCCPNVGTEGYFHIAEILQLIHNKNNYVHHNITRLYFDKPEEEDLTLMSTLYPDVTNVEFFGTTEQAENFSKFTKVTSLIIKSKYRDIEPFLTGQGKVLQKLDLDCVDDIDLNLLASKCPNLVDLTISAPSYSLLNRGATFKCLEKLNLKRSNTENRNMEWSMDLNQLAWMCPNLVQLICVAPAYTFERRPHSFRYLDMLIISVNNINDDIEWLSYFLASLNNLKILNIGFILGNRITAQWLDSVILYGALHNLEYFGVQSFTGYTSININDVKKFVYSCPKLKEFSLVSVHVTGTISQSDWTDFETEVEEQNLDLRLTYILHVQ